MNFAWLIFKLKSRLLLAESNTSYKRNENAQYSRLLKLLNIFVYLSRLRISFFLFFKKHFGTDYETDFYVNNQSSKISAQLTLQTFKTGTRGRCNKVLLLFSHFLTLGASIGYWIEMRIYSEDGDYWRSWPRKVGNKYLSIMIWDMRQECIFHRS